jgi:hypothetical protein
VISAAGGYQCSNFDSGTWSTARMVMTGEDSLFTELQVDVPDRQCSYSLKYLGFKPESNTSDPIDPGPVDPGPIEPGPIDPGPIDPTAAATLVSCNLGGCNAVALPFSQEASLSQSILPTPEWYTVGEFRLIAGPANVVISNIRAQVLSGSAEAARITGLTEGALAAEEQVQFELQSTRSPTASIIEFAFDIDLIPGSPSSFFSRVTLTTD